MAGQPRTTHKTITDLANQLQAVCSAIWSVSPQRYRDSLREQKDTSDPVCRAWVEALTSAAETQRAMERLKQVLADKIARADEMNRIRQGAQAG